MLLDAMPNAFVFVAKKDKKNYLIALWYCLPYNRDCLCHNVIGFKIFFYDMINREPKENMLKVYLDLLFI